ncbi:MAG: Fic family protein [Mycobacteriales bacterium]
MFSGDADPAVLSRAVGRGTLRRLASGIYTSVVDLEPERVVARHLWEIVSHEMPGAVLVDRTAVSISPYDGAMHVDHPRTRPLELPGLRVLPRRGPGPVEGDAPFMQTSLYLSSPARQLLDNLARGRGATARTLSDAEVEEWLDRVAAERGAAAMTRLRDEARALAPVLSRQKQLARLDALISAALGTGDADVPRTARLAARAKGQPVDATRLDAFRALAGELADSGPVVLPHLPEDRPRRALLPFYEAYFSNFIEGTEFTLDEAAGIVFDGDIPTDRPADAHDVLGTYEIVADDDQMRRVPSSADELEQLLLARHAAVMRSRPDKGPGTYKTRPNRAGNSHFVAPELVIGTLRHGFELMSGITSPFQRAVYMMFLISEVHPFGDGNGRVARIMMNAELVTAGEVRLIIPTVYRENYLAALRAATRTGNYAALADTLAFARRYTAQVDFSNRDTAERDLTQTHALRDAREAEDAGLRLILPSRLTQR